MKYFLLLLSTFLAHQSYADFSLFPLGGRLEGVGAAGGIAARWKGSWDFTAFGVGGDATGAGVLAAKEWKDSKLTIAGGGLGNVSLITTYQRGIANDLAYEQNLSAFGVFTSYQNRYLSHRLLIDWSLAASSVKINSFSNLNGNEINLGGANLQAINTYIFSPKFTLDFVKGEKLNKNGVSFYYRPAVQMGRAGLSDTFISTYGFKFYQPIINKLIFALGAHRSDATVLFEKENYNTDAEVRNTLKASCGSNAECLALENELVNQILSENTMGSATPMGGANTLRGFREFRFKSKHTSTVNTELFYNVIWENAYMGIFGDLGYASDTASNLYNRNVYSYGIELLYFLNDLPLRLGGAQNGSNGEKGSAWYLTVGSVF